MMQVYIPIAIAITCFILYALDRRSNQEPIDWFSALKVTVLGGAMAGGVSFAVTSTEIAEVVKNIQPELPQVQEMFVGVPTF